MTLSGPAVVAIVGVLWWDRRKGKAGSAEANTPTG